MPKIEQAPLEFCDDCHSEDLTVQTKVVHVLCGCCGGQYNVDGGGKVTRLPEPLSRTVV